MRAHRVVPTVLIALAAGALAAASPAQCQKVPRRPKLPAEADTNSADAYYGYGARVLQDKPRDAADAFYWAHMLSPDWPDPLYARWAALLLDRRYQLGDYLAGTKRVVRSREIQAIDSLYYQALMLNPFVYRRFDHLLFDAYLDDLISEIHMRAGEWIDRSRAKFEFNQEIDRDPALRGWMDYSQGQFPAAVSSYTTALKRAKYKAGLLASRARASFLAGDYDAALADMTAALQEQRTTDEKDLVYLYDPKAIFEHSIAIIHELRHEPAAAREAYAQALEEDLSYYQAHVRLAALALAAADTATFQAQINDVRGMTSGLSDWTPASGVTATAILAHERRVNLFGQGRRLQDEYRFGDYPDNWQPGSEALTTPGRLLPITSVECLSNPNIGPEKCATLDP